MKKFDQKKVMKKILSYLESNYTQKEEVQKEKPYLMRAKIHNEGMTTIERLEYYLFKLGFGGHKLFCKYWTTWMDEKIDKIDLDTSKIKIKRR